MIRGSFKGLQEFVRVCNALTEDGESALVEVNAGGERGEVVFVKGNLHTARLGSQEGISALRAILQSENISFLVREAPEPLPRKNVFVSLSTVMENIGIPSTFPSLNGPPVDEDIPSGVVTEVRIPESAEERVDDPRVQRAIQVFNLVGVERVVYAHQGRVRTFRGFGERDAHAPPSVGELREIRNRAQRWVDQIMLLFNASGGIHRDQRLPQKILLAFPGGDRWLWAKRDGEDLYVVWLDTSKLNVPETDVLEQVEKTLMGAV